MSNYPELNEPEYDLILKMIVACPDLRYQAIADAMKIVTARVRRVAMHSGIHAQRILEYQQKWEALVRNMRENGVSAMGKLPLDPDLLEGDDLPVELLDEVSRPEAMLASMGATEISAK